MVKVIDDTELRVVMDTVYNHIFVCRDEAKSVFVRIVSGYYPLDDNGDIQCSSCCPDTASEHKMMEKLLIDSLLLWTTQYKEEPKNERQGDKLFRVRWAPPSRWCPSYHPTDKVVLLCPLNL